MPPGPGDVLSLIRHGKVRTRGDIVDVTGLSRMTVAQRVDLLLEAQLIREGRGEKHTGGRMPKRLEFNAEHSTVVSAAVDTNHSRVAITDLAGHILAVEECATAVSDGPELVLNTIGDAVRGLLKRHGVDAARVSGFGISIPSPIDPVTWRPSQPPIMPGWDAYPITEHLRDILPVPVFVENDADAMALGEQVTGYPNCRALCLVKVSTGIGTGIVIDGSLYRGIDGGAGDIGHVRLAEHPDAECQCGARGCLAAVASGRAVARALSALGIPARSGRDVERLLAEGLPEATRLTHDAGREIGKVVSTLVCMLNPGVLLISGDLASSALIGGIRETLYTLSLPRATRHLDVRLGALGEDAAIIGMSRVVVDQVFSAEAIDARLSESASVPG
ncbi:MAG: ROK family protein [Actinobacteria bacterium]|nr:ROK family protein [Actinomycetota bacterium]